MVTLDEVLAETRRNRRICPQPKKWSELYELLPYNIRRGYGWETMFPRIQNVWWETPALVKVVRLQEHIEWAAKQGYLDVVYTFLVNLKEEEWQHVGE